MRAWRSTTGSSAGATKADAACSWFVCNRRAATGSHLQGRVGVDGQLLDLRIATSCPRPGTRAHGRPAAGPARQGRGRSAPAPARPSGSRRPGRTARAGCAGAASRSGSPRRRPASLPGPAALVRPGTAAAGPGTTPVKRPGQPGVGGDFEAGPPVGSLIPQGALHDPGLRPQIAAFSLLERGTLRNQQHSPPGAQESRAKQLLQPAQRHIEEPAGQSWA
jgi:hypothetical protein